MRVSVKKLEAMGFIKYLCGDIYRKDYPTSVSKDKRKYTSFICFERRNGKPAYMICRCEWMSADFPKYYEDCDAQEEGKLLIDAIDEFKKDMKILRGKRK